MKRRKGVDDVGHLPVTQFVLSEKIEKRSDGLERLLQGQLVLSDERRNGINQSRHHLIA